VADRSVKLRVLRRILNHYQIAEDASKGKGSHTTFLKKDATGKVIALYTVPTTKSDVLVCYVKGCRKRFGLREEDGTIDRDFYSH
jgi:hypothetical protein